MKIDLSLIIPALREEKIIGETLAKVAAFLKTQNLGQVEVVVVAADAGDRTAEVARQAKHLFTHFQVINSGPRVGKGHDVQTGMLAARGAKRIFMDADLATPLHHIPTVAHALAENDVVIGVRNLKTIHPGFMRQVFTKGGTFLIRTMLLPGITDSQCGFKGFTALAAEQLFSALQTKGWGFDQEILARAHQERLKIKQVKIPDWHEARQEGLRGDSKAKVALQSLGELARIKSLLIRENWPFLAKLWWLIPLVTLGLTSLLYVQNLGHWSIWFDEAFSASLIKYSPQELIAHTAADVHPPLYYLVLQMWAAAFGTTEAALRSLSVVCMLAALWIGILFVRRYFGPRASYMVLPFLLFAPFLLRYGQEARMYAMATLICMAATYVFMRAQEKTSKASTIWWAIYILLVVAGLYTHYYTGLIWIVHWVWHWYMVRQTPGAKFFTKTWTTVYGLIALAFLPWLFVFVKQVIGVQAGFWIGPVSHQSLLNTASTVLVFTQQWELLSWLSVGFMAILAGLGSLFYRTYKSLAKPTRNYYALLLLYSFVPIVVLFVLSLPPLRPILVERYFVPAMLGFYLLVGVSLALGPKAKKWYQSKTLLALLTLGFMILGTVNALVVGNFNFNQVVMPQAKELMAEVNPQLGKRSAVIADSPYGFFEFDYYTADDKIYFLDREGIVGKIGSTSMEVGDPRLVTDLATFGQTKDYVWIVAGGPINVEVPSTWEEVQTIQKGTFRAAEYRTN